MQAIHFGSTLTMAEVEKPKPGEDEALLKVLYAGICNTDLELTRGYMGFQGIPGHEFVAEVIECNKEPDLVWQRVVGEINISQKSDPLEIRHDPQRQVLGIYNRPGCFAEYLTMPVKNLLVVPGEISSRAATFVEPVAAALEILEQIHLKPSDRVAVIGDGKLGLLCCQVLKLHGASVTLVGKHEKKIALAEAIGIEAVFRENPFIKTSRFDVVVECSGSIEGLPMAMEIVKPRGIIVQKTTTSSAAAVDTNKLVVDEITLLGSRCGPFAPALKLLQNKSIEVESLIEAVFPLSRGLEAMEKASQPGTLKVLLHNS